MSSSTVYDVKVRYSLDDKASNGANKMATSMDRANKASSDLKRTLALIGAGTLFAAGKKFLIDFNSEIDQMKIGMTTIMNMQLKTPWAEARKEADGLFKTFQELAKKSPATTKDFMQMATAITPVIASMGGGTDKIEKLTQGAVLAGIATGTRADVAALDIKQMLLGNVTERDMMANQLISAQGMTKEGFNALSAPKRGAAVEKMLSDPALMRAADEFGESFAGQVSTFKDQLQITLGQVGLPLVKSMGEEIKRWNKWIERNPQTIQKIVTTMGHGLKSSFEFIQSTVGWLVENRETIFSVAKIFVAFKGAQMATGAFAGFVNSLKNIGTSFVNASNTIGASANGLGGGFSKLIGILSGAGGVIPALAGLGAVAYELWDRMSALSREEQRAHNLRQNFQTAQIHTVGGKAADIFALETKLEKDMDRRRAGERPMLTEIDRGAAVERLEKLRAELRDPDKMAPALSHLSDKMQMSGFGSLENMSGTDLKRFFKGGISTDMFEGLYGKGSKEAKESIAELNKLFVQLSRLDAGDLEKMRQGAFNPQPMGTTDMEPSTAWKGGDTDQPKVEVTIHTVEVQSEDPDRFVFGLAKAALKAARNPTQAASTFGGEY